MSGVQSRVGQLEQLMRIELGVAVRELLCRLDNPWPRNVELQLHVGRERGDPSHRGGKRGPVGIRQLLDRFQLIEWAALRSCGDNVEKNRSRGTALEQALDFGA